MRVVITWTNSALIISALWSFAERILRPNGFVGLARKHGYSEVGCIILRRRAAHRMLQAVRLLTLLLDLACLAVLLRYELLLLLAPLVDVHRLGLLLALLPVGLILVLGHD